MQHGFRSNRETDTALTAIHGTLAHYTAQRNNAMSPSEMSQKPLTKYGLMDYNTS